MSDSEAVLSELRDGVLTITLNNSRANALTLAMIDALQEAFKEAARSSPVRSVLLTGAGSVFCAGQDLSEIRQAKGESFRGHLQRTYNPLILQIRRLEKPVLAGINGPVAGAGLGIALACDLRIAANTARFVVGFAGIGLAPDSAISLLLPSLIGLGRAAEFTFSNQPFSAEQALAWGLVNRLVPSEALAGQAYDWALALARGPVGAMALAKRDFNKAVLSQLETVLDYEAQIQEIASQGDEHQEGVRAFFEKRSPRFWTGEIR
jgi:2-(1,2-epoxy-1,2-dihydrophenyl)acetyl-CoA isomerase